MEAVNRRVVVIILTMNQCDRTSQCLQSLLSIQEPVFDILVWDNGSKDNTVELIGKEFPDVLIHYHPENLGVASGRNAAAQMAIKHFNPSHILFLDNDMLVEPEFVSGLLKPFSKDDQVGQTQAKLRFMDDRTLLNDGGGAQIDFVRWQVTPVGYKEIDDGQYDTIKKCISCGGAMMVRAEIFQQLGGFDKTFDPFGPEDLDFSLRLQAAGYLALYAPEAVAYHVVSHTYGKGYSEDYARHKSRHWYTFMSRHASPAQKVGFFLLGAPYMALRVIIREGRRGNIGAFQGLVGGFFDSLQTSFKHSEGHDD